MSKMLCLVRDILDHRHVHLVKKIWSTCMGKRLNTTSGTNYHIIMIELPDMDKVFQKFCSIWILLIWMAAREEASTIGSLLIEILLLHTQTLWEMIRPFSEIVLDSIELAKLNKIGDKILQLEATETPLLRRIQAPVLMRVLFIMIQEFMKAILQILLGQQRRQQEL